MSKRAPSPPVQVPAGSQVFWKSLESKADPAKAQLEATAEFPLRLEAAVTAKTVAADDQTIGRRSLLKMASTAAAASTLAACRRPVEKLVPYTRQVEYSVPGVAYHYASARVERGDVIGLVAEVHENRPTKLEGNTEHPSNRGSTDLRSQASILDLYDPDRPGKITRKEGDRRVDATPAELDHFLADVVNRSSKDQGAKLRLLVEPSVSPTFLRLRDAFLAKFPQAKVCAWTPLDPTSVREGSKLAFGQVLNPVHDFSTARAILSLDSDFLQTEPSMLRSTKSFVRGRMGHRPQQGMGRLYVVEPSHTTTGSNADNRLRLAARDIETYILALCKELSTKHSLDLGSFAALAGEPPPGVPAEWLTAVAADLVAHRGRSVVVAGSRQPARVHALVHAVNAALGNNNQTVHFYATTDETQGNALADIKQLAADLDGGKVDTLVVLGGNPAYDAPADLAFAQKLAKAKSSLHLGSHLDETGVLSSWYVPKAHDLEAWGDARAVDGSVSIMQPLIAPLHDGISEIQILGKLIGETVTGGSEAVQATLRANARGIAPMNFTRVWNAALQKGVLEGVQSRPLPVPAPLSSDIVAALANVKRGARALAADNLEVSFLADPKLLDGRHANNPWLQELPDPLSKLVWDNAAYISQGTAKALGVSNNDVVRLGRDGGPSLEVPVFILPGTADNCVALHLGWGRTNAGRFGGLPEHAADDRYAAPAGIYPFAQQLPNNGAIHGFNAYAIRTSDVLGFGDGFKATKIGKTYKLVTTHEHHTMEGRPIAIDATLEEFKKTPDFPAWQTPDPDVLPLWDEQPNVDHKWGMAIDLSTCTGCNSCTIACQAENNIAFVGKDQVSRGREMYWIRIDRYFVGDEATNPKVAYQPVACVHCEQAPCENVCPVNATEHSPEGLNDMVYNRCVGTRYCGNNCPYKVRRFNYLEFQGDPMYGDLPQTMQMQFNPNVTVRMRGVMEKCTYCVQRIEEARISARRDTRTLKDGDIVTACAQACPADAIVFGDLNDPRSRLSQLVSMPRGYRLLSELGTHPRTTHLGKIRNPNTEMA
jgi:Fe-S-cluster-containing dehydrogenase component/anaerobic selenocysteine-containing dehydrogenase